MLKQSLQDAMNKQVNFELYSSYLYLAMSAYFAKEGLNGFANWMKIQVQEELLHAMKLYDYIIERDGCVELQKIEKPQAVWDSPLAAFKHAYEHEGIVTSKISDLMDKAFAEKDHASSSFLQWFINEQVEEEANTKEIVDQIKLIEQSSDGLFMLNRELAQRTFNAPAGTE